jgi:hypothetical protein
VSAASGVWKEQVCGRAGLVLKGDERLKAKAEEFNSKPVVVERREREVERERVSKPIRPGRPQMMRVGTLVSEKS